MRLLLRFCCWIGESLEPKGADRSIDFNRTNGRWRVHYPDGAVSQPFCLDVARGYRDIFGGKIVRIDGMPLEEENNDDPKAERKHHG